jgi:hypothetical protein
MRNISFMLTVPQILARQKTVTRRLGWWNLKPGELLCGVEKGMGLKPGEKIIRLATVRVIAHEPEPLRRMTDDLEYGRAECILEGFGDHPTLRDPEAFVRFFCSTHKGCSPDTVINRIAFEYVDEVITAGGQAALRAGDSLLMA